jgi:glycosyltransferase involved in cell wall biosynthesis
MSNAADVGNLGALDVAAVNRLARKKTGSYDLVVSTMSEMSFKTPSVQYVHYPNFNRSMIEPERGQVARVYERVNRAIAGTNALARRSHTYIANSRWTADRFKRIYAEQPKVVYPPVDTSEFVPLPWDQRENGVLIVGRVAPDKRLIKVIEAFARLCRDGYDGHLRIVGPIHDAEYGERVKQKAKATDAVRFDGRISRSKLVMAMSEYRYAIHGKRNEHFGMVVAEFIAAGMLPFVANSGGQTEIIGNNELLTYDKWSELREKFLSVSNDREMQLRLRKRLPDVTSQFGQERFRDEIRSIVSSKLAEL